MERLCGLHCIMTSFQKCRISFHSYSTKLAWIDPSTCIKNYVWKTTNTHINIIIFTIKIWPFEITGMQYCWKFTTGQMVHFTLCNKEFDFATIFYFLLCSTITQFTHHTLFLKTVTVIQCQQANYQTLEESFYHYFFMQSFNCNCRPTTINYLSTTHICLSAIILHADYNIKPTAQNYP